MLAIKSKKHGVDFVTVWYARELMKEPGIYRYRYALEPLAEPYSQCRTLVSDLTLPVEELAGRFTKNCRYEIRRAPKEGVECECLVGRDIPETCIEQFGQFFEDFWKSKGIASGGREKYTAEIREYAREDAFAVSMARLGEKILVYHTYIVGDDFVRLYQSASHFRLEEDIPSKLVGMANRYLHREDMLFFKGQGKKIYDWGGAGAGEGVESITKFKEAFGGEEAVRYEFEYVSGFKEQCVKKAIRAVERVTS